MSSSTTPPTPVDSGECVVCGQITTTRCSSCASHGTRWMYFCSKEHQKLIWFSHKRVCGVNSSPFKWPWLTKEEKQEMVKSDLSTVQPYGDETRYADILKKHGVTLEGILANIVEDYDHDDYSVATFTQTLIHIRGIAFQHTLDLNEEAIAVRNRLIGDDPFGLLAANLGEAWKDDIKNVVQVPYKHEWSTRLHHRLLIFFSIVCHFYRNGEAYPDPEHPHYEYTRGKVIDLLRDEVSQTYPDEALALSRQLDKLVVHSTYFLDRLSQSQ